MDGRVSVSVQAADFDLAAEYARLAGDATIGAIVQFVGCVRNHCDGSAVSKLTLEHYPGMTEKVLQDIGERARVRWNLHSVRIVHRVGPLDLADQIVLVQVASTHRGAAFEAAQAVMDFLKIEAPFWKQEATPDGTRWVDARAKDDHAAQRWHQEYNESEYDMSSELTHFDATGQAVMVDVHAKAETHRVARAAGRIRMKPETYATIAEGRADKGDVIGIARIAAIQATKRTGELIPLCHPLALTKVVAELTLDPDLPGVHCEVTVETIGRTGVEMEALTGLSVGLLTVYDMCKAVDRGMVIEQVQVMEKQGGKSGHWKTGA